MSSNISVRTKSDREFSNERKVKKARKEHECCFCKKSIPKGSSYTRTVGVCESMSYNGNEFFSNAWHAECLAEHMGYIAWNLRRQG